MNNKLREATESFWKVIYEHIRISGSNWEFLGEHIMAESEYLELERDFLAWTLLL